MVRGSGGGDRFGVKVRMQRGRRVAMWTTMMRCSGVNGALRITMMVIQCTSLMRRRVARVLGQRSGLHEQG